MSRSFSVVIERDEEDYFVASVPALPGCHTQAKSLDQLMERVREAIALCLEMEGGELPEFEQTVVAEELQYAALRPRSTITVTVNYRIRSRGRPLPYELHRKAGE